MKTPKSPTITAENGAEAIAVLRRSEQRLRLMIDAVRDYAIFTLDPEGRIQSWNSGAERLKGYKPHEIIGKHISTLYTEADRLRHHPEHELEIAKRDGRYEEEGWRVRKDGTLFWANVLITALFDDSGTHVGFTKVTRDFTERRSTEEELRQSEERLRLLVESVKDYAIFMLDPDGTIRSWNSGAQQIKGYTADEAIGRNFSMFYTPADVAAGHPQRELEIAGREGRHEEEGWRVRKNGELFRANVVLTAVYGPQMDLRGFAKVTRDLTEMRRIEHQARLAEQEVAQERDRVNEAQRMVQLRDEFISVAAHELRTPLTALQLKLQGIEHTLEKEASPPPGTHAKLSERLHGALRQVDRLTALVERLLDVSRIVSGSFVMKLEPMDLAAVVRQVVDDLREAAQQSGSELRLATDGDIVGRWDVARLEQVVVNVVSNAIKYGGGEPIDVGVEKVGRVARIVVTDRGIGIAQNDIDRIFGRFERAAPSRHYGGLGLGLYVTRNIVEAHGGSISVSSRAGQGSTFAIELPIRDDVG
ncbi:MAG TPA: PAS domain S-box protein [Nannocystaceae bacterium]|nr:PAS domain S-box protein [Nannocystaceae bacterium]